MMQYKIEDIQALYREVHRKTNEGIEKGNNYYNENNIPEYPFDSWKTLQKSSEMSKKAENDAWNMYFDKLEQLYPGCLSSKEFARFYASHLSQLNGFYGQRITQFYDRFSGEGQIGLIENFSYNDYTQIFPEAVKRLEHDILANIEVGDYAKLNLYYDGKDTEEISSLSIEDAVEESEGKKGKIREKGLLIRKVLAGRWNEEEQQFMQDEYSNEAVFVPIQDFSKARVWNESETELSEIFENMTEQIKGLPYKNMIGLLKQMKLFPSIEQKREKAGTHEISEIAGIVSDRIPENINKVISEISLQMQEKQQEDEHTMDD